MKENSIEEDIKIVENYLANSAINEIDSNFFKNSGWETVDLEIPKSMQHILSDYKRVLKENKKIRNGRNRLFEYATAQQTTPEMLNKILREDYIPKDKIEEILDETEITDFNSLVEAFLEIKKLLESEE